MSGNTLEAAAGELDAEEVLAAVDDGRRVVISVERFGSTHRVTLRHDGRRYYCDTPTTLHRHEDRDDMRRCITEQGYIRDLQAAESETESESGTGDDT